jgi:hypothetical protein
MSDDTELTSAIRALAAIAERTGDPIDVGHEVEILATYFGRNRIPKIREQLLRHFRENDISHVP